MAYWLKLVGKSDWPVAEHWVQERSDLLKEIRFGDRHRPTPISTGDHLVYHAVGDRRLIAVVEVRSGEARYDDALEWERQWPWVLDVRPVVKVGRVSQGPPSSVVSLSDSLTHQSFVRLSQQQYATAVRALKEAGAR